MADVAAKSWIPPFFSRILFLSLVLVVCWNVCGCGATRKKDPPINTDKAGKAARDLGEAYMRQGNFRMALGELQKADVFLPDNDEIKYDLGLVYMNLAQPGMAVDSFKEALALNPEFYEAKNSLGSAYLQMKRYDLAEPVFLELTKDLLYNTPQYPVLALGFIYYEQKQYGKSVMYYKKALEYDGGYARAWRGLGRTHMAMGQYADAIKELGKAVELAPGFAEAYFDLGEVYQTIGNQKKALENYKKVISLVPGKDLAIVAQSRINLLSR